MRFAIQASSVYRAGKLGVLSHELSGCNHVHAFSLAYVRWFSTVQKAQKYIDTYLFSTEKAVIVSENEVLMNTEYFK